MTTNLRRIDVTRICAQGLTFVLWWSLVYKYTRAHLHTATYGPVVTRPTWLPFHILHALQARRALLFAALPVCLIGSSFVAGGDGAGLVVRVASCVSCTLYHLVESSVTNRHGEYPLLYASWALLLPPAACHAAVFGATCHFILSTAYAKLRCGPHALSWIQPGTMK